MVSLDKTTYSIQRSRYRARLNEGLRRNDLRVLPLEFGERVHDAEAKAFETYKAIVLGGGK
ncbi:hypothetical protein [Streptomyces sp. NPDC060187]|uniref:hypothetical protein n=1 Tax=Streptomyces sp. NPDC060187 TaxID=3347067 RepID=UPI00365F4354